MRILIEEALTHVLYVIWKSYIM